MNLTFSRIQDNRDFPSQCKLIEYGNYNDEVKVALGRGRKNSKSASGDGDSRASTSRPQVLQQSCYEPEGNVKGDCCLVLGPHGALRGLGEREREEEAALSGQANHPHVEGDQEYPEDSRPWIPHTIGD
ncbi:hypothetical protein HAX54_019397 [Datura stramonium]|uniref:Uncharacterized protein n=1 Tax=Datura stramonium TaxID=4076 RepID=A0ABS8S1W7_DATST|nr:hypothetical protein [Datura stramonium]